MGLLDGKVAVVTGSGGGIGRAVAEAYAREGAKVVVNSRTAANVDETVARIKKAGGQATGVACDVSDAAGARQVIEAAASRWGSVDVLVNNAAVAGSVAPLERLDPADFEATLRINVLGPALVSSEAVKVMRRRPFAAGGTPRGKIIDVSSGAGRGWAGDLLVYRVSKAALLRLSNAVAAQYQNEGIDVNTVDVFATTPMVLDLGKRDAEDPSLAARMRRRATAQEPTPEDNAPVFVWLASSKSDGVTGRNFAWSMNVEDLDRARARIASDPRALRVEMVPQEGVGTSAQARAYQDRVAAMQKKG
jgi:NAD(P)-dependent dehydrogenase (short-subunit alcohol dehydrogenase family)